MDGALVPLEARALRADDTAGTTGLGCYSTARWDAGRVRHADRVAARLVRDAARLGLPPLEVATVRDAMAELGRACFGSAPGVLRFQASADGDGAPHLVGIARALGSEPDTWRAVRSGWTHEGPGPLSGVKLSGHPRLAWVRRELRDAGADEALLLDAAERLVEGTRSNLVVCHADGRLCTPPLARGAVAGVAREILMERVPELEERDVGPAALARAREIIAINAVRGARAVVGLDDGAVGDGRAGPWSARLDAVLAAGE